MPSSLHTLSGFSAYTTQAVRLVDLTIVLLCGWLAYWLRLGTFSMDERYLWLLTLGALLTLLVLPSLGIYQSWRGRMRGQLMLRLLSGFFLIGALITLILFLAKSGMAYSRLWLVAWMLSAAGGCILIRAVAYPILNRLRASGRNRRTLLLIGDAHSCATAWRQLQRVPTAGFEVERILLIDDDHQEELAGIHHERYTLGDRLEHTEEEVWICLPLAEGDWVKEIQNALSQSTGNVRYMPDLRDFRLINHSVSQVADLYLLDLSCSPMTGSNRLLKWLEDKLVAALILLLISPVLAVLAVGVKLSSPGPVFYRQERVGLNGVPFMMLKFRSMPVNAEKGGVQWGGARNKEVTAFGAFLRKTSLDELPQFLNVFKGDMSIVGPRPERTQFVQTFKNEIPGYMQKHMVKAGITGWAQINGWRGDTDLTKRIECDLWYIKNWSLWLDVKIILLTVLKGFVHRHAY
ncbi:undecaprenyl-phosphate glucose phosphotransferase [Halomonas piscis]|uniref:Undecaprenyl-phosphate glucose phosphotransferase n=1 Tax=Halomonas piscis TaxID=3031727 RepID=A0ABY9Z3E4_9GAMM|nr:undecaprenyl-phosphate glucose phosphotransferase [Halomonas piscis]WNK21201.1 undecaprenyl-phosphate glucose phosphotransferase [Halomonas piscis]